jgi:hypothetical protein
MLAKSIFLLLRPGKAPISIGELFQALINPKERSEEERRGIFKNLLIVK